MQRGQRGFTLVEIAIVLVVIGLLLGGVLKGQELINSSRVRAISDQHAGIQAAYYGFQDRYRAIPGDMDAGKAAQAIGVDEADLTGGNGDGQLEDPTTAASTQWEELTGVWAQLSHSGFISGSYNGTDGEPSADEAPINAFNGVLVLGRHAGYYDDSGGVGAAASAERLVLTIGHHIPVDIARELDVKVDDGSPQTGTLRNAIEGSSIHESDSTVESCIESPSDGDPIWDIADDSQNCNPAFLF